MVDKTLAERAAEYQLRRTKKTDKQLPHSIDTTVCRHMSATWEVVNPHKLQAYVAAESECDRLRETVRQHEIAAVGWTESHERLSAENARLWETNHGLTAENARLLAENARLRAALRRLGAIEGHEAKRETS
jgi:hypothetical protein